MNLLQSPIIDGETEASEIKKLSEVHRAGKLVELGLEPSRLTPGSSLMLPYHRFIMLI